MTNEINRMHKAMKATGASRPTKEIIAAMFHRYQEARRPRMKLAFDASYQLTRLQTCDGILNYITMMYLVPMLGFSIFADSLSELCAGAPKFDFIPVKYDKPATVKWRDEEYEKNDEYERDIEVIDYLMKTGLNLAVDFVINVKDLDPGVSALVGATSVALLSLIVLLVWNMLKLTTTDLVLG